MSDTTWRCEGDPIECSYEVLLGQREAEVRRLRERVDQLSSLLAAESARVAERDDVIQSAARMVERIVALHERTTYLDDDDFVCSHCLVATDRGYGHRPAPWPCATARITG